MATIVCAECGGSGSHDIQSGDILWFVSDHKKVIGTVFKNKGVVCVRWIKSRIGQITLELLLKDLSLQGIMLHKL